ncbi:hypothetical protein RKLH11_413 [Rhodobacteraceae bacterium KLH11]|nr:hypothetical protein RKLH11_413 [Rhodobacteraceae bacterium KLH11]
MGQAADAALFLGMVRMYLWNRIRPRRLIKRILPVITPAVSRS